MSVNFFQDLAESVKNAKDEESKDVLARAKKIEAPDIFGYGPRPVVLVMKIYNNDNQTAEFGPQDGELKTDFTPTSSR